MPRVVLNGRSGELTPGDLHSAARSPRASAGAGLSRAAMDADWGGSEGGGWSAAAELSRGVPSAAAGGASAARSRVRRLAPGAGAAKWFGSPGRERGRRRGAEAELSRAAAFGRWDRRARWVCGE
jgi:hypothetical protein